MWRASPSAEAVQRQLLALQDQWQLLKQTAASQSKALGGLRSLQDFNRKAERLEAWIKHKVWGVGIMVWGRGQPACPPIFSHPCLAQEEKPSLAALLQESPDKIQLTRRILDLKKVRGCWGAAGMSGTPTTLRLGHSIGPRGGMLMSFLSAWARRSSSSRICIRS